MYLSYGIAYVQTVYWILFTWDENVASKCS